MSFNKDTGMYEGYIYLITNKVNGKQYVGQTSRTIEKRIAEHFYVNDNLPIHNSIKKYGKDNFDICELEKISEELFDNLLKKLDEKEIYYIQKFNSKENGYNCTLGGKDITHMNEISPVIMYDLDGLYIDEFDSIRQACDVTGYNSASVSESCSKYKDYRRVGFNIFRYKDNPLTEEDAENIRLKYPKIYQYDFDGNLLNTFNTLVEAQNYMINIGIPVSNDNIGYSSVNHNKSCGGYIWRRYPDNFNTYELPTRISKQVEQRDMYSGELIAIYENCADASRKTGFSECSINSCCNNNILQSNGFYWCFSGEFHLEEFNKITYHKKKVDQYTRNGNYVATYNSIQEAADSIGGNFSKISGVCAGHRKTAYDYVWRYHGEPFDKYESHTNKFRKINAYTLNDVYVGTFNSGKEAKYKLGFNDHTSIYKCCQYKMKSSQGYRWDYADDVNQPDKTKIIDAKEVTKIA